MHQSWYNLFFSQFVQATLLFFGDKKNGSSNDIISGDWRAEPRQAIRWSTAGGTGQSLPKRCRIRQKRRTGRVLENTRITVSSAGTLNAFRAGAFRECKSFSRCQRSDRDTGLSSLVLLSRYQNHFTNKRRLVLWRIFHRYSAASRALYRATKFRHHRPITAQTQQRYLFIF